MSPVPNPFLGSENLKLATGIAAAALPMGSCIKRTANAREFELCDTLGEQVAGIVWDAPLEAGKPFSYALPTPGAINGRGRSGAAIGSIGANLTTDASGKLVTTVTTGHYVVGQSQSTVAGADELVEVALEDGQRQLP